ncbi:MAG TPA: molybdopterin cofactor-binding domain-containing protein, partial [Stellaceae bacterium]|nr:molybdopterin cofactor-binding domain-containing protein [Stellaceae bacterium]
FRIDHLHDARAVEVIEAAVALAGGLDAPGGVDAPGRGLAFARYKNIAAYCAIVADVEVEEEVRVSRIWCAADAGLVVNPDGAKNQLEGGIVQAISWALKEGVRLDQAGISSRDWETYPVLKFSEVPEIEVALVDPATDNPPLGIGEASGGPTVAAIGNAVARALGARLRDLPLTRDRVMAALLKA